MLIVGLGNPGPDFHKTRHNFGFIIADKIAERYEVKFTEKFNGLYGTFKINNNKIILLKPQTFMNRSGMSVASAASFFSEDCEKILVMHDEIEINLGKLKYRIAGSSKGHNGLRSITSHIGPNYHKLSLGIDRPPSNSSISISDYVLQKFPDDEYKVVEELAFKVSENLESIILEESLTSLSII